MHKIQSFPLRISGEDRHRARNIASGLGVSENRLYATLIQEGLLMREQMAYFDRIRAMGVRAEEGLAILDALPDAPPQPGDELPSRPGA